jgi:hypothetical protein
MSVFDEEDTLCSREGNVCKLRYKCQRYMKNDFDGSWVANYFAEFGRLCVYQIPLPKEEAIVKTGAEIKDDKGS